MKSHRNNIKSQIGKIIHKNDQNRDIKLNDNLCNMLNIPFGITKTIYEVETILYNYLMKYKLISLNVTANESDLIIKLDDNILNYIYGEDKCDHSNIMNWDDFLQIILEKNKIIDSDQILRESELKINRLVRNPFMRKILMSLIEQKLIIDKLEEQRLKELELINLLLEI
jgi:hypothetical protein